MRHFETSHFCFLLVSIIAITWSIFQLYAAVAPVNATMVRSFHLGFALSLCFLLFPAVKRKSHYDKIPWYGYIFSIVGILCTLYIFVFEAELAKRPGQPVLLDLVVAIVDVAILLEAGRRSLGLALTVIGISFLFYDVLGPYLPDIISHRGASIERLADQIFLSTEGIFGVPLGVSASFVFLFVLFGALLDKAGAGRYFIDLAHACLGRFRGGPAKASVVASGLTGIMNGSSIANTVTTGTFTIPLMKRAGFMPEKAGAIEVAASTNGQIMPPVMGAAAFIMAEFLGLTYSDVVYAAFIPAFASYFGLFYIVHLESCKLGLKGEDKDNLPKKLPIFLRGIHYLVPVFYLLYTLVFERKSAHSAAFNAIMLTMLIMLCQKPFMTILKQEKLTFNLFLEGVIDILAGFISGAKNMIPIAIATSIAGIVVGSITLTGVGQVLTEVIETIAGNNILLILILTALTSILLGMGLPTTANYIIMASLTAPVTLQFASDGGYLIPAIAAHLFVFYFGILADVTPPVGLASYAASGIAKSNPIKTGVQAFVYDSRTVILPFMFFFNPELVLIQSVDPYDLNDASSWCWITNPLEIVTIFIAAILGIFCFANSTQGYMLGRLNMFYRSMLLILTLFFFVPNIVVSVLNLEVSKYVIYGVALVIYGAIFARQLKVNKKNF